MVAAPLARGRPVRLDAPARPQPLRRLSALLAHRRRRHRRQPHEQHAAPAQRRGLRRPHRSDADPRRRRCSSSATGAPAPRCCTSCSSSTRGTRSPTPTSAWRRTTSCSPSGLFTRLFWFLMPSRRPMDNMAAGWDKPQEDEFALCHARPAVAVPDHRLPQPSAAGPGRLRPRTAVAARAGGLEAGLPAFPPRPDASRTRAAWSSSRRRTACRIQTLLELFPDARFVHIVRDPYVVFPSTVNLWKSLYRNHGLQTPTFAGLEEHVFETFNRPLCEAGGGQAAGRPEPLSRAALRGPDPRPGRRDAPAVRPPGPGRLRRGAAAHPAVPCTTMRATRRTATRR